MINNTVTITFPVYERFDFFEEALNSALNQTVQCPIIVVDNGSSHNKFKLLCEKYQRRVKYYRNPDNIGMFPNWNRCFELAETEYAIIVGDDDILMPTYIEEFLNVYEKHPEIGLYYTNIVFYKQIEKTSVFQEEKCNWTNIWGETRIFELKKVSFKNSLNIPSISCIINVKLQRSVLFETRLHTANDKQFIYSLPDDTIVWGNDKELYKYRRHSGNDSTGAMLPILLSAHMLMFYDMRNYSNLTHKQKHFCYRYLLYCFFANRKLKRMIMDSESYYTRVLKDMLSSRNAAYIILEYIPAFLVFLKRKLCRNNY